MSKIRAAIFDLDGLLLNTEGMFDSMVQQYAVKMTGMELPFNIFKQLRISQFGRPKQISAQILHATLGLGTDNPPEHYLEWRKPLEEEMFPQADLLPGAANIIQILHGKGFPMAIATSSERRVFGLKTSRHADLFTLFNNQVITGDQVKHGKPHPEIFLKAAQVLGIEPGNCVVFEDADSGVAAGKAAGMFVVAVPHPWLGPASVAEADLILASLDDFELSQIDLNIIVP